MIDHPTKKTFHIALYEPEIPANTGNIIRLCACLGVELHLIHPLGFNFDDKHLKRAGLDYHDLAKIRHYPDFHTFMQMHSAKRIFALTTKCKRQYWSIEYAAEDIFLFGPESRGLPEEIRKLLNDHLLTIPMQPAARSLNLSNAVAIIAYEAARQLNIF